MCATRSLAPRRRRQRGDHDEAVPALGGLLLEGRSAGRRPSSGWRPPARGPRRPRSASRSTTTCSTGRGLSSRTRSIRSRRSQPERGPGWVEITISSGSWKSDRVHGRRVGVGVAELADRLEARVAQRGERDAQAVADRLVHRVLVDHVAVPRLVARADHVHGRRAAPSAWSLTASIRALPTDRLVGDHEDAPGPLVGHSAPTRSRSGAGGPVPGVAITPWTAPGTPYS